MNRAVEYLKYVLHARNEHGLHSPFLFELYNEVFKSPKQFYCFDELEAKRAALKKDHRIIKVSDFGAGSNYGGGSERAISKIAKQSLKSKKYAQLLFRLAHHLKPKRILELGTSLGLSTCYLALSNSKTEVVSIEACPNIHREAKEIFKHFKIENVKAINATFQDALPELKGRFDIIFIDGHHDGPACLAYLEALKKHLSQEAFVVVDDIRWSQDMFDAWMEMKQDPFFQVSLDVFELGILVLRPQQSRSHHILRY
ncbi:MAG: class I SAM-dependent methyltransferase [Flavobacteriales bacterium]|nr:class I SAM-dependent methyltransferase [Flavobacteriales bacterium]